MSVQKTEFSDANFDAETREGLSVVCFEEPSDNNCRKQVEIVEKAANEIAMPIKVGKCDVENCFALAQRFRVTSIPTTMVFKDGKEVERLVGYRHEFTLVKHLKEDSGEND
jgi:thioredoxin 1